MQHTTLPGREENFRSTCGSERGAPECSKQGSPGATPHVVKLVSSGLRNRCSLAVLTPVRAFASVKERSLPTSAAAAPRTKTTGEPIAQRHHHADDGLRNERPPGRHVEGSHSKNQSGSD